MLLTNIGRAVCSAMLHLKSELDVEIMSLGPTYAHFSAGGMDWRLKGLASTPAT